MLRGRYGIGWMIVAWVALAAVIALAIVGGVTVARWLG